jgi:hypothetical protein
MDELVRAFAPAFAAGFALQRLAELLDPILDPILGRRPALKKAVLSLAALILGIILAAAASVRVMRPLNAEVPSWLDIIATGLFISGGTEGFNSLMKFLGYKKEEKKREAAAMRSKASDDAELAAG